VSDEYNRKQFLWEWFSTLSLVISAIAGFSAGGQFDSQLVGWLAFGGSLIGCWILAYAVLAIIHSLRYDSRIRAPGDADDFASGDFWLFLRPFDWDVEFHVHSGQAVWNPTSPITDREVISLAECLSRTAAAQGCELKIVGGNVSGPVRRAVMGAEWQDMVLLLMRRARRIVILPSSHAGTLWELELVIQDEFRAKSCLIVPPLAWAAVTKIGNEDIIRKLQWATRLRMTEGLYRAGLQLPHMDQVLEHGGIYHFGSGSLLEPIPNKPTDWETDGVPRHHRPTLVVDGGKLAGLFDSCRR
jgi:hypothetical protein